MDLTKKDILRLRKAINTVGTPRFPAAYRKLIRAKVPFAIFLMIRFDPGKAPVLLETWSVEKQQYAAEVSEYIDNTYPFDPFYQYLDVPDDGGLYRLTEIAPDRFFSSQYYLEYYRRTGLLDEVGLLVPLPSGARAHVSISRSEAMRPYRQREIQCLKHHAPLLLELLCQHVAAISPQEPAETATTAPSLAQHIRTHARDALGTHLTQREAQIAALVLRGHSNGSAAMVLEISRETSKVHRRNLYRKLAISSQRDLFGLLKHLL